MVKKLKSIPPVQQSPLVEEVVQSPVLVSENPVDLAQTEPVLETPPSKPVKAPRIRTKKTKTIEQNQEVELVPTNLLQQFEQVVDQPYLDEQVVQDLPNEDLPNEDLPNEDLPNEEQEMQIDQSQDSELWHITNLEQRKLAQEAKATLKRDIIQQAHLLVHDHLNDFPQDMRKKVGELVVRLYDDPVSLFSALKASNRGQLKLKFKNIPRPTLLGEQKTGLKKLEGFRQFLAQRISRR